MQFGGLAHNPLINFFVVPFTTSYVIRTYVNSMRYHTYDKTEYEIAANNTTRLAIGGLGLIPLFMFNNVECECYLFRNWMVTMGLYLGSLMYDYGLPIVKKIKFN